MNKNTNRIGAKDLVNIGIYAAIYLVITCALAFLSLIPVMYPLMTIICPIVGGIPFMLFLTKTKKFGMITIMGILMGLVMLLTGMGYWSLITGVIAGLLADLVWKAGKYTSAKMSIVTNGVFSLWYIGNYMACLLYTSKGNGEDRHGEAAEIFSQRRYAQTDGGYESPPSGA